MSAIASNKIKMNQDPISKPLSKAQLIAIHQLVDEVGRRQLQDFGQINSDIKPDGTLITECDRWSDKKIVQGLSKIAPGEGVLSEEGKKSIPSSSEYWVVDPLDGTKEFINKTGEFTVNIAMINNKKVIFGIVCSPVTGKIWHGSIFEDVQSQNDSSDKLRIVMSKSHKSDKDKAFLNYIESQNIGYEIIEKGSSLKLCCLADNEADIYPRFGPTSEWDIAAAHAVLNQKGGSVIKIDGYDELAYAKEDSILNPFFIAFRNNSIKSDFLPVLGDFFKKLV